MMSLRFLKLCKITRVQLAVVVGDVARSTLVLMNVIDIWMDFNVM